MNVVIVDVVDGVVVDVVGFLNAAVLGAAAAVAAAEAGSHHGERNKKQE